MMSWVRTIHVMWVNTKQTAIFNVFMSDVIISLCAFPFYVVEQVSFYYNIHYNIVIKTEQRPQAVILLNTCKSH